MEAIWENLNCSSAKGYEWDRGWSSSDYPKEVQARNPTLQEVGGCYETQGQGNHPYSWGSHKEKNKGYSSKYNPH